MKSGHLAVCIHVLPGKGGELEYLGMSDVIGGSADESVADGGDDVQVNEGLNDLLCRIKSEFGGVLQTELGQEFILVVSEFLEDAFVAFLSGEVSRALSEMSGQYGDVVDDDGGAGEQEEKAGSCTVLVCPIGKAKWFQQWCWGQSEKPAGACEHPFRLVRKDQFEELCQRFDQGGVHGCGC